MAVPSGKRTIALGELYDSTGDPPHTCERGCDTGRGPGRGAVDAGGDRAGPPWPAVLSSRREDLCNARERRSDERHARRGRHPHRGRERARVLRAGLVGQEARRGRRHPLPRRTRVAARASLRCLGGQGSASAERVTPLRQLRESDIEAVLALYQRAFADERPIDAAEIQSWLRNPEIDSGNLRVLDENGQVSGYGDVWIGETDVELEVAARDRWGVFLEWAE